MNSQHTRQDFSFYSKRRLHQHFDNLFHSIRTPKLAINTPKLPKMTLPSDVVLPVGSLVLVTGANGLVGAEVINQLLALGYREASRQTPILPFLSLI